MTSTTEIYPTGIAGSVRLKVDVMFQGIRYSEALGKAAEHAFPNFYPYRFAPGEHDPTGTGKANIPYLMTTPDGTLIRVKGAADAPWTVQGDAEAGYELVHDDGSYRLPINFEPLPEWMGRETSDGFPMAHAGVSLHGDMLVVNVAPGCEYFLHKHDGKSMRCTFCSYGAPDQRTAHLGQKAGQVPIPELTLARLAETLKAAVSEMPVRHIYLVGGSLTDWAEEGRRFVLLARAVKDANDTGIPVMCGSGALPDDVMETLHGEGLVDGVCFNLEVWSEALFEKVCPGKNRFVGYDRWIASLEKAVSLWGRGRVYSAMVAGIELEPEHGLDWQQASDLAVAGAADLCSRGIMPIYSLYWPVAGRDHPDYFSRLRQFFETLNTSYREIREREGLTIWDGFMSHRSAYMQLECDLDRVAQA
ncbi:MAG: radical SAM protein [Pseudomonadota bacterium]